MEMKMSFEYAIESCGRVKMAGGTFSTYYDLADALINVENPSTEALLATHHNFKNIRYNPPFDLLLAFFPDEAKNIQYRLRGAGAYRHLRMDQGPGGNFTRFDLGQDGLNPVCLTGEQGFAMPEELINQQLNDGKYPELSALKEAIQSSFEKNDYKKTAILVNKFNTLAEKVTLQRHKGDFVGSKSGFFFIRPAETERNVQFPLAKVPQLREKIDEALTKTLSLAEYSRAYLYQGLSFGEAVQRAEKSLQERGKISYDGRGLLYFQPDCFVDKFGNIEVEKINMPDVGFFMTMLHRPSNRPLQNVVNANVTLRDRLKLIADKFLEKNEIVLLTRTEVLQNQSDTLELLEIQSLKEMLESIDKKVTVLSLENYGKITKSQEILLLNVDPNDKNYAPFAEHVIRKDILCYADPLVYYFKDRATTLKTMQISGKYLEQFLQLIKPKEINAKNAENLYHRLEYVMKRFDMTEDVIYAHVPGYKMPLPAFKYSMHSFGQIYKAYEKSEDKNASLHLSAVPINQNNALFYGKGKPRLAAFRFMCTKER